MSGYRDVRMTTSTVSSGGGGSAWGSGVFRNTISREESQENISFVDDHDRTPIEKHGFNIKTVCCAASSFLVIVTVSMIVVEFMISGKINRNSTNHTNFTQLLRA